MKNTHRRIHLRKGALVLVFASLIGVSFSCELKAQHNELGLPYLRNYLPGEYHAVGQNWAVLQDGRGLIYAANAEGVLIYDGSTWRTITITGGGAAHALAVDRYGRIYTGGANELGFLQPDSQGSLRYHSLLNQLAKGEQKLGEVLQCCTTNQGTFFLTAHTLLRFRPGEAKAKVWHSEAGYQNLFGIGNTIYVNELGKGLLKLERESFQTVEGGELFAEEAIAAMFRPDSSSKEIILAAKDKGLFRLSPDGLQHYPTTADAYLADNQISGGAALPEGGLALATLHGGLVVLNGQGRVSQIITKSVGLLDDGVNGLCVDAQNGAWLTTNSGIARVELAAPLTNFDARTGLAGSVSAITRYNGTLYAATSQGLYALADGGDIPRFAPVAGIAGGCRALLPTDHGLLIASLQGIFLFENGHPRMLNKLNARVLAASQAEPNRVFVGLIDGVTSILWNAGSWLTEEKYPGVNGEVHTIVESKQGEVWLGMGSKGALRMATDLSGNYLAEITPFTYAEGLPEGPITPYQLQGEIKLGTRKGTYKVDPKTKRCVPDSGINKMFGDSLPPLQSAREISPSYYWLTVDDTHYFASVNGKGGYSLIRASAADRISQQVDNALFFDGDKKVWFGGYDGIVRYEVPQRKNLKVPYSLLIRRVDIGNDSLLFAGNYTDVRGNVTDLQPQESVYNLPYSYNALRLEYAATSYDLTTGNQYQYQMEGLDKAWSNWVTETQKDYTNLPEGKYTFKVRARNVYGRVSGITTFRFVVLPPWYRAWWAYLGYMLLFGSVTYGTFRWRVGALEAEKRVLEQKVQERTEQILLQKAQLENAYEEIRTQNENLVELNREIELKNRDITDSITYARRIQDALLPMKIEIDRNLPEVFVFYRPRDIVSGDFYWFSQRGSLSVIAAVDCTGHGVPGAFMSVMGNSLLNQIINERQLLDPAEILEALDEAVKNTLRQVPGNISRAQDGMDIALCVINLSRKRISYSGANRPLVHVSDGILTEVAPSKFAIGGRRMMEDGRFKTDNLQLKSGDMVYIFSDGYADQFGGPNRRKFMNKHFKELLRTIADAPVSEQSMLVERAHNEWRGTNDQVDDILVIGIRV